MALSITVKYTPPGQNEVVLALPDPVEVRRGDELLWSEGTGRGASDGLLVGSVIAKKQTWTVRWGVIPWTDMATIRSIPGGFFTFLAKDGTEVLASFTAYRSDIQSTLLGMFAGVRYWKDVEVQFTER